MHIWKEFPCGCVFEAILLDGTPIIDAWSGSCDDDSFQRHVASVLQDFQNHPLGWLLAELGWSRGRHIVAQAPEP
jgi:hypothetical protein